MTLRFVRSSGLFGVSLICLMVGFSSGTTNAVEMQQGGKNSRKPEDATKQLIPAEGLETTLFASEPDITSITNIDIDHRGRIWACEVTNYRKRANTRKEGDRILILEDTDQDGRADTTKVFYQGRDVDSALGICVLDNRVIVSCAPNVIVFIDENGDDKPDKKEFLFTRVGRPQHDHSTHAFLFGPDGRLYWNFGNTGIAVHDAGGKLVVDNAGFPVRDNGNPYFGGMVFRCDMNGRDFEVLGHNFRNNYETTIDSFGTLWQSDNDDDGNKAVRINYVMEYGNYGYRDEFTKASWKSPRTGMHKEVPRRHWHLNDPGVVPNLLQTGQGSPTGICLYEGELLPEAFQGQMLHCDAGPNVVRAYPVERDGAGYSATMLNLLHTTTDKWFRPSDVCVAPDGSVFVADWYDPGVGGHNMGDTDRGRIFRIAPPNTKYVVKPVNTSTIEGAIEALKNPCLSTRYLGWTALYQQGDKAEAALKRLFESTGNPRMQARALWLLGRLKNGDKYIRQALDSDNVDLRIVGLRVARSVDADVVPLIKKRVDDQSPAVRRACLIALRDKQPEALPELWTRLALKHDGQDRWYLEALGIAAHHQWDACFAAWKKTVGDKWNTPAGRDIIWRARTATVLPLLAKIILDESTPPEEYPRYFRALDFHQVNSAETRQAKNIALLQLLTTPHQHRTQIVNLALNHGAGDLVKNPTPDIIKVIDQVFAEAKGTSRYVELVDQLNATDRYNDLITIATANPDDQLAVEAVRTLLKKGQQKRITNVLSTLKSSEAKKLARALGNSGDGSAEKLLTAIIDDAKQSLAIRREAVRGVAKIRNGAMILLKRAQQKKIPPELKEAVAAALHSAQWQDIKTAAEKNYPLPGAKDGKPLPTLSELVKRRGDPVKGRIVFMSTGTCHKCHQFKNFGKEVGPDLSEIGSKLSRQALYESILFPSAGISHNYETYSLITVNGNIVNGLMVNRTDDEISIKGADSIVRTYKTNEIDEILKQKISLMPADLQKVMSEEDLVDIVEFMTTLKKKG